MFAPWVFRAAPALKPAPIALVSAANDYGEETAVANTNTNTSQLGYYYCADIDPLNNYKHSEPRDSEEQYWKLTRCNLEFTSDCLP